MTSGGGFRFEPRRGNFKRVKRLAWLSYSFQQALPQFGVPGLCLADWIVGAWFDYLVTARGTIRI